MKSVYKIGGMPKILALDLKGNLAKPQFARWLLALCVKVGQMYEGHLPVHIQMKPIVQWLLFLVLSLLACHWFSWL